MIILGTLSLSVLHFPLPQSVDLEWKTLHTMKDISPYNSIAENLLKRSSANRKNIPKWSWSQFMSCDSCPSCQWNRTGYHWSPVRTLLVAPLWCDLGCCSRTVVVIKLRRTSAFGLDAQLGNTGGTHTIEICMPLSSSRLEQTLWTLESTFLMLSARLCCYSFLQDSAAELESSAEWRFRSTGIVYSEWIHLCGVFAGGARQSNQLRCFGSARLLANCRCRHLLPPLSLSLSLLAALRSTLSSSRWFAEKDTRG